MNAAVLWLVAVNVVATGTVFVLAYAAGARSGGKMLWELGELRSGALYILLCAAAALAAGSLYVFFRLSNAVCAPVRNLTEFAEQLSAGNFGARLKEVGGGTFGYINLHLNEAAARAAKVQKNAVSPRDPQGPAEEFVAVLRRVREAADDVSANAHEILRASEKMAAIAAEQERQTGSTPLAVADAARVAEIKPRSAAASMAATVAATLQPAVVAPPVSIPGAQITGAVNLPLPPPAAGRVAALPDNVTELRLQLVRLQSEVAALEKKLASAREQGKS